MINIYLSFVVQQFIQKRKRNIISKLPIVTNKTLIIEYYASLKNSYWKEKTNQ